MAKTCLTRFKSPVRFDFVTTTRKKSEDNNFEENAPKRSKQWRRLFTCFPCTLLCAGLVVLLALASFGTLVGLLIHFLDENNGAPTTTGSLTLNLTVPTLGNIPILLTTAATTTTTSTTTTIITSSTSTTTTTTTTTSTTSRTTAATSTPSTTTTTTTTDTTTTTTTTDTTTTTTTTDTTTTTTTTDTTTTTTTTDTTTTTTTTSRTTAATSTTSTTTTTTTTDTTTTTSTTSRTTAATSTTSTTTTTTSTTTTTTTVTKATIAVVRVTTTRSTQTTTKMCEPSCVSESCLDSSGAIAFWPFEDSYVDMFHVYNGYSSDKLPSFAPGYIGKAVLFNAQMHQCMFTPFIPLNNVSFTVHAWIKPTAYPNPRDHSIVGLCPIKLPHSCLHINIRNKKLYFGFYRNDIAGSTTIALNQWVHVAFVYNQARALSTIYLNGIPDGRGTITQALSVTSGNFTIGTNEGVDFPNNYFQGYIDELTVTVRAKSDCEILEVATLAGYFKFDDTSPYVDSGPNAETTTSSDIAIVSGYKKSAISFSGSSQSYFQAWSFTSFGITNQPFSITLWIKPEILSGTIVHLSTSSTGTGSLCFSLLGFDSSRALVANVLTAANTIVTITGPVLSTLSWTSIVQTWSPGNGLLLYVNNVLVGSATASTFASSEKTPNYLTLGNCLDGCHTCANRSIDASGPFKGLIDEWRIYSRELTENDVCALYSAA